MADTSPTPSTEQIPEPLWYRVQVERKDMKQMMGRTNWQGLVHFFGYLALLALFATLTVTHLLPTWARVVSFLVYATVYCFSEAILHETHHRTAFRTPWVNETVHYLAGLLSFSEPLRDRWLHAAHHTYTSYPQFDPEIVLEPPPRFNTLILDMFRVKVVVRFTGQIFHNAVKPDALTLRYVPPTERRAVRLSAQVFVAYYLGVVVLSIVLRSWWPILFVFVARFVGAWLNSWIMFLQHGALQMSVPDWRRDARTVLTNPVNRFLVWNMNYHVEHHMYPTVPFHSLPALQRAIAYDCPPVYPSTIAGWREMLPALWRQRKEPTWFVERPVPVNATVPPAPLAETA